LSGLLTALALERQGIEEVVVFEAGGVVGGVARSLRADGYVLEPGVGTFPWPHPSLTPLFELAQVTVEPTQAHRRFIYLNGELNDITHPGKALRLVGWKARLRVAAEPLVRSRPVSTDPDLASFLIGRLGDRAGQLAAELMAAGVFAGDPSRLSVRSAFPMLVALVESHGSLGAGLWARRNQRPSPRPRPHLPGGGMDRLVDTIAAHLGDRLRLNAPIRHLERDRGGLRIDDVSSEQVVLAVDGSEAASLLGGMVGKELLGAPKAPVVVAGFSAPAIAAPLPDGFGVLVPGPSPLLGILLESSYAPGRAAPGQSFVKVIAGGALHPELVEWDRSRVETVLGREVARVFAWPQSPQLELMAVRSIPQYPPGHGALLADLEVQLAGSGIHLGGWSFRGPGISQLAIDAHRLAGTIASARP
jgi:oxygen-dependent protoporphyrinogen oxidase